ncbi:MAG: hypothetical protein HC895_14280 [Leptolyngbyaceae cyanobacterium SM1_3_5]|nr:hypothetical protein [Leptolyngbyaceae cyanobacterium SM1_3_5]
MVRKRNLSDLLRDEAGSLDDSEDNAPAAEQTIDVSAELAEPAEPDNESAIEPARRSQPTKADLQAIATDLTVELEAVRDREQQLEQTIADLKVKLESYQAQQSEIEQLRVQLQQQTDRLQQQADQSAELAQVQQRLEAEQAQTAQLKTELEAAKQLVLKLSEANSKPQAKPEAKPQAKLGAKPEEKPVDRPAPTSQRAPLQAKPLPQRGGAIAPARPNMQPRPHVPIRPIAPNNVPYMPSEGDTRLTDADIAGWIDANPLVFDIFPMGEVARESDRYATDCIEAEIAIC